MAVPERRCCCRSVARLTALATLGATAWLSAAAIVGAQPTYRLVEVAPSSSTGSRGAQIDPTGRYVAGFGLESVPAVPPAFPTTEARVFLWSGGTSTYLARGAGRVDSNNSLAVNASGQVVGTAGSDGAFPGADAAYRWSVSAQTRLQSLPGDYVGAFDTAAFAVNAAGHAVGASYVNPSSFRPVQWLAGSSAVTLVSDATRAAARSINDAGDVVGSALVYPCPPRPAYQCGRATLWSKGALTVLEPPGDYSESSAYDINEAGQIVGRAYSGNTKFAAVLWTNGTPRVLQPLNQSGVMWANSINAAGLVVGRYRGGDDRAFLWQAGVTHDLTGLLDASSAGWIVGDANSISDDGKIAVDACRPVSNVSTRCVAAVLIPTPPAPPVPAHTRYLAEGATGPFFDTQIALLNPGTTNASVTLQYLPAGGAPVTQGVTVPARTRITVNPKTVPGLANAEFSTVVQSSQELVVDRTMSWDGAGYGSHSETAVKAPATTWYLAEGATIGGFDLFYLLQNPSSTSTTVSVRYLRGAGAPLTKTLRPAGEFAHQHLGERRGVPRPRPGAGRRGVQRGDRVAGRHADHRRARDVPLQPGADLQRRPREHRHHDAGDRLVPGRRRTGPFFDMFVLIANPTATDAQVSVTYLTIDGVTYSRTLVAPATSRSGIWVDQEGVPGRGRHSHWPMRRSRRR